MPKIKEFCYFYRFNECMDAIQKWYNETSTFNNCISIINIEITLEDEVPNGYKGTVEYYEIDTTEYELKED